MWRTLPKEVLYLPNSTLRRTIVVALLPLLVVLSSCSLARKADNARKAELPVANQHVLEQILDCGWVPPQAGAACNLQPMALDGLRDAVYASIEVDDAITGCEPVVKLVTPLGQPTTTTTSYYVIDHLEAVGYITQRMKDSASWGATPGPQSVPAKAFPAALKPLTLAPEDTSRSHGPKRDDFYAALRSIIGSGQAGAIGAICIQKKP